MNEEFLQKNTDALKCLCELVISEFDRQNKVLKHMTLSLQSMNKTLEIIVSIYKNKSK